MSFSPKLTIALVFLFTITFQLSAQNNLMKEVFVGQVSQQRVGNVLENIARKGNFTFAYNNRTVPADSLVNVSGYRGTLYNFLSQLLGNDYEFKEVPGYIVVRHAPGTLNLSAEVEKEQGKQTMIKGHVTDNVSNMLLKQVSVYERNQLISTLTNAEGYFELRLKEGSGPISLSASKENYRDTSIFLLQEVRIHAKPARRYAYYPDDDRRSGLQRGISRWFINSKQSIQNLNIGGFFAYAPYQISLTPGLSSQGLYNSQVIDHFSLNLLGGYTAGIQGVEVAGLFNIDRNDVSFLQAAGIFNVVGGNTRGLQVAGIYNNVLNSAGGIQVAGIINKAGIFTNGLQLAGLTNSTGKAGGFQIAGLYNKTSSFTGLMQLGGLANFTKTSKGLQISGLLNHSGGYAWSQFAGIVNIAEKVKGFQFAGLVNVADSSDYPIGLVNFIKNGEKSLALSTDEYLFTHLDFRSGGRVLYGIIGAGYSLKNRPSRVAIDLGFGAHIHNGKYFSVGGEYAYLAAFSKNENTLQVSSLRILPAWKPGRYVKLFAGPTVNFASSQLSTQPDDIPRWTFNKRVNGDNLSYLNIGLTGGLQFTW